MSTLARHRVAGATARIVRLATILALISLAGLVRAQAPATDGFASSDRPARPLLAQAGGSGLPDLPPRVWMGPDEKPLPFRTHEEILEYLRTADVMEMQEIPVGITRPRRALLEKDGVRMRAAFRDVDLELRNQRIKTKVWTVFYDQDKFEVAAYRLARMLGMDNVPPVVERRIGRAEGTLQIWLEGAMTEQMRLEDRIQPEKPQLWFLQNRLMHVFDNLIWNDDRNTGNILIDSDWKVWLIDHTRAFQDNSSLMSPEMVTHVERVFWQRLQALEEAQVREQLAGLLDRSAIDALLRRRERLIAYINELIAQRGEEVVIFDWTDTPLDH